MIFSDSNVYKLQYKVQPMKKVNLRLKINKANITAQVKLRLGTVTEIIQAEKVRNPKDSDMLERQTEKQYVKLNYVWANSE